jgi:hypothetical protein
MNPLFAVIAPKLNTDETLLIICDNVPISHRPNNFVNQFQLLFSKILLIWKVDAIDTIKHHIAINYQLASL